MTEPEPTREPMRPPPQPRDALSPTTAGKRYGGPVPLGEGGMGVVYRVRDLVLHREVVMKQLKGRDRAEARQRFIREARVTAQLEHPGIVPVHELDFDADGVPYFTMKLIAGETLGELLVRISGDDDDAAAWTTFRRLQLFRAICQAVAFAHSRGVLHRDLKPANIMVGAFGEVQVMDWGLARVKGDAIQLDDAAKREKTPENLVVGTAHYMSPEQARGEVREMGPPSDVYSLGLILFQLLAMRPAYPRIPSMAVLPRVADGDYDRLGPGDPTLEPELVAILGTALAHDVDARYPDVPSLMVDLDAYMEGRAVSVLRESPLRRMVKWVRRHPAVAAALVALAIGLAGADAVYQLDRQATVSARVATARTRLLAGDHVGALRAIDEARRLEGGDRWLEGWRRRVVDQLVGRLERVSASVPDKPPADDGDTRRRWYRAQTRLQARARDIARSTRDPRPRRVAARSARRLSRQLRLDGQQELAVLLLDQAAVDGLPPAELASERAMQRRARQAKELAHRDTIERLLQDVAGLLGRGDPRYATLVARATVAAASSPHARRALATHLWRAPTFAGRVLAAEVLSRVEGGDPIETPRHMPSPDDIDASVQGNDLTPTEDVLQAVGRGLAGAMYRDRYEAWMPDPDAETARLTARQHVVLSALWFLSHPRQDETTFDALTRALADAGAYRALAAASWREGPRGRFWSFAQRYDPPSGGALAPHWEALILGPSDPARAGSLLEKTDYARATLCRAWLRLARGDRVVARRLAELLQDPRLAGERARIEAWASDDPAHARMRIAVAIDAYPASLPVLREQAELTRLAGDPAAAEAIVRSAMVLLPDRFRLPAPLAIEQARCLLAMGRHGDAMIALESAAFEAPRSRARWLVLADVLAATGQWEAAFSALDYTRTAWPKAERDGEALRRLIALVPKVPNTHLANTLFTHLYHSAPRSSRAEAVRAATLLGLRTDVHFYGRLGALVAALEAGEARDDALLCWLIHHGRFDEALVALRSVAPNTPRRLCRARALRGKGRLAEAQQEIAAAIAAAPAEPDLYAERAEQRVRAGDSAGALAACDRALALDRWHAPARLLRATLHESARRWADAAADLQVLHAIRPASISHMQILKLLARMQARVGERASLLATLDELLLAAPGEVGHRLLRAQVRFDLEDRAGAARDLRRVAVHVARLAPPDRKRYDALRSALEQR